MGKVLKESVHIAFTYAKVSNNLSLLTSLFFIRMNKDINFELIISINYFQMFLEKEADPGNDFLHTNSIHLHVPEGATPKVNIVI